jgi:hypothetical protein
MVGAMDVDGSILSPPKELTLEAWGLSSDPTKFSIYKIHPSIVRQAVRHIGIPDRKWETDRKPKPLKGGKFRSEGTWSLPLSQSVFTKRAKYQFLADTSSESSGEITSTRKAYAIIETNSGANAEIPEAPVGLKFLKRTRTKIQWAIDPVMNVRLVTGGELAEYVVGVLEEEYLKDPNVDEDIRVRVELGLRDLRSALPVTYRLPSDWMVEVPNQVEGKAGETIYVDLPLTVSSEGQGYFALVLEDPEDPEAIEISEACAIQAVATGNESLNIRIVTDFDDMDLPMPERELVH